MTDDVLGPKSQQLKRLKRLGSQASARRQEGVMIVEGPTLVVEALAARLNVEAIYVDEEVVLPPDLMPARIERVRAGLLAGVLSTVNPQPVVAVVQRPRWSLDHLVADRPVLVIVEGRDPGNVGTLWRTAEAAGFSGVVLAGNSVDPTNPKVIRASAGAALRLPLVHAPDVPVLFDVLRAQGRPVFASALTPSALGHDQVDLTTAAIVLGNESHGLSPEILAAADAIIGIELAGPTESLNVAAAGAVLCFEALRQRRSFEALRQRRSEVLRERRPEAAGPIRHLAARPSPGCPNPTIDDVPNPES